ncbi:MAG TPA: CPBP family intramembrane glutamic endopeptidase [Candidatus Saccharimonadales bacterium]|jgi:membrane protease YdiL (CAAX protease family)|nr:CPBP family intramembrane glutamic endopeptidase [Candidatus Saccharimonadales bacterium]
MTKLNRRNNIDLSRSTNLSDIPDWSISFAIKAVFLLIAGPLFLLIVAILAHLYFPPMAEFLRENLDSTVLSALLATYYVPFLVYMVVRLKRRPNLLKDLGFKRFSVWTTVKYILAYPFVYLAVVLIGVLVVITIARALGFELTPDDIAPGKEKDNNYNSWVPLIAAVLIAPIVEEVLFRGILLQAFARKYGWLKGSLFSSGIFSLLHGPMAPLMMIFSLYISRMYYKTGSVLPGIILHAINNTVVSLLILTM